MTDQVQSVVDASGNVTTYSYDQLERLSEAHTASSSGSLVRDYRYSYDGDGNRLTASVNLGAATATTTYSYNSADELAGTSFGATTTATYDADGNLTGSSAGASLTLRRRQQNDVCDAGGRRDDHLFL